MPRSEISLRVLARILSSWLETKIVRHTKTAISEAHYWLASPSKSIKSYTSSIRLGENMQRNTERVLTATRKSRMGGGPIAAMLAQSNFGRSTTIREPPGRRCDLLYLARDKYLCQYCLKKGLSTPATEVDHVAEIQDGGDEFDEANCLSTCSECHLEKTRLWQAIRRRVKEVGVGEDMLSDDPDSWLFFSSF